MTPRIWAQLVADWNTFDSCYATAGKYHASKKKRNHENADSNALQTHTGKTNSVGDCENLIFCWSAQINGKANWPLYWCTMLYSNFKHTLWISFGHTSGQLLKIHSHIEATVPIFVCTVVRLHSTWEGGNESPSRSLFVATAHWDKEFLVATYVRSMYKSETAAGNYARIVWTPKATQSEYVENGCLYSFLPSASTS